MENYKDKISYNVRHNIWLAITLEFSETIKNGGDNIIFINELGGIIHMIASVINEVINKDNLSIPLQVKNVILNQITEQI